MASEISKKDKLSMEVNIMMALFHSTVEQSNMLTGELKQQHKVIFARWQREGFRQQKILDQVAGKDGQEFFEEIMTVIEEAVDGLRKHFTQKIIEKNENIIQKR